MKWVLLFLFFIPSITWSDTSILTIKPFLQFNKEFKDTYGFEVGYWPHQAFTNTEIYLGYDVGLLGSESTLELYSDVQLGSRVIGVSAGPYFIAQESLHTGLQFSAWINFFAGFNFKTRWNPLDPMGGSTAFYIAVPLIVQTDS